MAPTRYWLAAERSRVRCCGINTKIKFARRIRDEPQFGAQSTPLDERTERLILALVFAAKSDGHIDAKERAAIDQQLREAGVEEKGRVLIEQAIEQPLDPQRPGYRGPQ